MSGSGTALDGLLREVAREAVAEGFAVFKREIRQLTEEWRTPSSPVATAEYVSVKQAAKTAGVHDSTVRGWIKAGKLKAYQPEPRILRVRIDELHALMAGGNAGSDGEVIDFDDRVRALTARAAKAGSKKK